MNVTLWKYLPGQKRIIMEDAMINNRTIMFCNSFGDYELIDNNVQQFNMVLDPMLKEVSEKNIHILCNKNDSLKKIVQILRRKKIRFTERNDNYTV